MTGQWHHWLYVSVLFLASCGLAPAPTLPPPTLTATPISTELPVIETAVPAGFNADNPIQIVIVPADLEQASEREEELEDLIASVTDVAIDVIIVETQAEASNLVCASSSGTQSAAWVDGMTYAAINLGGCGVASFRAVTPDGTGRTGVVLVNSEYEDTGVEGAAQETFCRLSVNDLFSWTIPMIVFNGEGIAIQDISDVNEVEDNDTLIEDVYDGSCAATGMPEEVWEAYLAADEEARATETAETDNEGEDEEELDPDSLPANVIVVETTPEIPYNVFAFPLSTSLDVISQLEMALITLDVAAGRSDIEIEAEATEEADTANDTLDVDAELLDIFFGEGAFEPVSNEDFEDFLEFVESSGIDFVGLRN